MSCLVRPIEDDGGPRIDLLSHARILIVDDEPANVRVLQRLLQSRGYRNIRATTDPDEVLTTWDEFQPDLLLLDLMMPGKDGIEAMTQLKESARVSPPAGPPILVMTADVTDGAREISLANGARDVVTKPFDHDDVMANIEELLATELAGERA